MTSTVQGALLRKLSSLIAPFGRKPGKGQASAGDPSAAGCLGGVALLRGADCRRDYVPICVKNWIVG